MTIVEIKEALLAIEDEGVLRVADVVEAARPKDSPLHECFTWDDGKAAAEYRLEEARRLIRRALVFVEFNGSQVPVRAFVSLGADRKEDGGGYRQTVLVMRDTDRKADLLAEAMSEMELFERKYHMLVELSDVLGAMRKVKVRRTTAVVQATVEAR